jgi:hypothetical protein
MELMTNKFDLKIIKKNNKKSPRQEHKRICSNKIGKRG